MNLKAAKNEVANQIGYNSWEDYMNEIRGTFYERERIEKAWEEVCYRYAQEESKRITVAQKLKKLLQELKIRTHDKKSKNVHGYL